MKKKIAYCLFITAFFILCIIPSSGMLIWGESEAAANEMLSMSPSIYTEDGNINKNITDDITSYIADRFAFRQEFITAYAKLHATIFGESSSEDVLLGNQGWLYYNSTSDDYLHNNTLSDREISYIARTLKMMQQYAESRGVKFAFTVAPNKNTIYPQYMPDIGQVSSDQNNLEKLTEALKEYDVNYGNLTEAITEESFSKLTSSSIKALTAPDMYHKLDSHWNNLGAALGLKVITETLGVDAHDWYNDNYDIQKIHKGDLYEMLYPAGKELDEQIVFDKEFGFTYSKEHGENIPKEDSIKISTVKEGTAGSLLMFRDSFGNALYPFMADSFGEAVFSRLMPYRMDWLDAMDADSLVIEIVERNINNLLSKAPIMAAPIIRDHYNAFLLDIQNNVSDSITVNADISQSRELAGYSMISGNYDASMVDQNSRVFIMVSSKYADGGNCGTDSSALDNSTYIYEACPVGATDPHGNLAGRFTAYIPDEILKDKGISVILSCKGSYSINEI